MGKGVCATICGVRENQCNVSELSLVVFVWTEMQVECVVFIMVFLFEKNVGLFTCLDFAQGILWTYGFGEEAYELVVQRMWCLWSYWDFL